MNYSSLLFLVAIEQGEGYKGVGISKIEGNESKSKKNERKSKKTHMKI